MSSGNSFVLQFVLDTANLQPGDLVRLGEAVHVLLRTPGDDPTLSAWDAIQNYASFGSLALEVVFSFAAADPKRQTLRIGVPIACLSDAKQHLISIRISPVTLELIVDDELHDEQWPADPLKPWSGEPRFAAPARDITLLPFADTDARVSPHLPRPLASTIQYFTPPGHNAWVGDTMCITYRGVFHLFYLFDRRHHSSKFSCGAHQIAHISSPDLRNWTHHAPTVPLTAPWMTCGTGMPIIHNDELLLFYGLHTDRVVAREKTCVPQLEQHLARSGQTIPVPLSQPGVYPMGSVITRCRDGETFTVDPEIIHHCQNPSPFVDPTTGRVYLLAGYGDQGLYETADLRHWRLVDRHFLPNVQESPIGNTLECQCYFQWRDWHYIIAGRTGFWMSRKPLGPYWQGAKGAEAATIDRPRWDVYDGLWVPTVAHWHDDRRILTGWLAGPDFGWAGHLVFRELIQHEDGTLGTRWCEEMIPLTGEPVREGYFVDLNAAAGFTQVDAGRIPESCRITLRLSPASLGGAFGIRVGSCELKLTPSLGRAQWCEAERGTPTPDLPALEEILAAEPYQPIWSNPHPNIHFKGGDFVIQHVESLDRPITLDLIVLYDAKSQSTIVDACIDGRRTMITRRPGMRAQSIDVFAHRTRVSISDLVVRPLL